MKTIIVSVLLLMAYEISSSQEYVDVLGLPKPDSTGSIWNSFYDQTDKIMVLSDRYGPDREYQRMYGYFLSDTALRAKKESELTEDDYNRPLLIFGPVDGFKHWEKFQVRVNKTRHGFTFADKHYQKPDDGVFYSSPERMVYTGNSLMAVWELQSQFQQYPYTVVRHHERVFLGEYLPEKAYQIDLIQIRNNNYRSVITQYFKLYVSKKIDPDLIIENTSTIDSVSSEICKRLKINPLTEPIVCYIHSEPNEATFFANFYFMQGYGVLPKDKVFGTVFMNQLHCVGFSLDLIKHEGFHALWEKSIGLSINAFFSEGIQEYDLWGQDTAAVNHNINIFRKHADYDMSRLVAIGDIQSFWGGPTENNWPIAYPLSGLFVRYLINQWGLPLFKEMYVIEDKEIAFRKTYNKSVDEVITEFRNTLLKK